MSRGRVGDYPGHPFRGNQHKRSGGGAERVASLASANKIDWKTGDGIDPDIRDQVIEQAKEDLQGDLRRVKKLSGISQSEWKSLDRDQKDEFAVQFVEDLEFKDAVKVFGKEAVKELQEDFGGYDSFGQRDSGPEPNLERLAKENKIPASVSDVPAGGKGSFADQDRARLAELNRPGRRLSTQEVHEAAKINQREADRRHGAEVEKIRPILKALEKKGFDFSQHDVKKAVGALEKSGKKVTPSAVTKVVRAAVQERNLARNTGIKVQPGRSALDRRSAKARERDLEREGRRQSREEERWKRKERG